MKKVVMLLSNPFRPDPRVYKEAKTLIENGYDVTIVAWDREMRYERVEDSDGINVERIRISSSYDNILDMILKLPFFWLCLFIKLIKRDFDIIHCHDFDTLPIGLFTAKFKGKKVIYDAHELYSGMVEKSVPSIIVNAVNSIERRLIKNVQAVITVNKQLGDIYRGYGARYVAEVMNCGEIREIPLKEVEEVKRKLDVGSKKIVLSIGMLEPTRNLERLIDMFESMDREDVIFIIGGYGSLVEKIKEKTKLAKNVRYIGWIPINEVLSYVAASHVSIMIHDPSNKNIRLGLSTRLFEAMGVGKPVVVSDHTANSDIVRSEKVGLVADYDDAEDIEKAIFRIIDDDGLSKTFGENGRKAAISKYNWEIMGERLINAYEYLGRD
jgi:glycosyltransferase involved in cell wall biosynthesis